MKKTLIIILLAIAGLGLYYGLHVRTNHNGANKEAASNGKPDLLLVEAEGKIRVEVDNTIILTTSEKKTDYILDGPLLKDILKYKNKNLQVIGKGIPINPVIVNAKPITAKIWVVVFGQNLVPSGNTSKTSAISTALLEVFQKTVDEKRLLRAEITKKFKNEGVFNLAKGRISKETREVTGIGPLEHITLVTDEGDSYLLTGPALKIIQKNFDAVSAGPVIILGMETLPDKGYALKNGETPFAVRDAYTASLEPIK